MYTALEQKVKIALTGRVLKIRKLGKKLTFAILYAQQKELRLVFYSTPKIKRGDWLNVLGVWKKEGKITEFEVLSYDIISGVDDITKMDRSVQRAIDPQAIKRLMLRSKIIADIHEFFRKENFSPVTSPTIVGNWVKGQTGNFSLNFYDDTAHLTISNMLYHHNYACLGLKKFYEIGKLFREERPSNKKRLAEFTILDISATNSDLEGLMRTTENLIETILIQLKKSALLNANDIPTVSFSQIRFSDLLSKVGLKTISGHQFNGKVKRYLNEHYDSFVWVTNFPENTRPFYVKCTNGYGSDCQLWYKGVNFLAAGGERETAVDIARKKIINEGKNPENFQFYLDSLEFGIPDMWSIGLGIERFISAITEGSCNSDFIFFPVYQGQTV